MSAPIVWFSVNLKSGGMRVTPGAPLLRGHGSVSMEWLQRFPEIVLLSPARPDVIFLQEAEAFDTYGDELLHYVERSLRRAKVGAYRGFLTRSMRSAHHQVVFLNVARMEVVHHWRGADPNESRGLYGFVETVVDDDEHRTVWLKSVHLDPRNGNARLDDVMELHVAVPLAQPAVIAGDFNSITSHRTAEQGEPQRRFLEVPVERRFLKGTWPPTRPGGDTDPDTRALDYLLGCGWTNQHIADRNTTPTVAAGYEPGGGLIIDRCLTRGLTTVAGSVWVDTSSLPYSDHRAVGGAVTLAPTGAPT